VCRICFSFGKIRKDVVEQKSVNGPSGLITEQVLRNDWPSDFIALEADNYSIGVAEAAFVDQHQQRIRTCAGKPWAAVTRRGLMVRAKRSPLPP
jgi:hypothetical protein